MIQEAAENCLQANTTCTPADSAPTSQPNLCRALLKTRKGSSSRNLLKFKVQCKSTWKRSRLLPTYTRRNQTGIRWRNRLFWARIRDLRQNKLYDEHIHTIHLSHACYHFSSLRTEGKNNTAGVGHGEPIPVKKWGLLNNLHHGPFSRKLHVFSSLALARKCSNGLQTPPERRARVTRYLAGMHKTSHVLDLAEVVAEVALSAEHNKVCQFWALKSWNGDMDRNGWQ